jgi:hypothetical protein
VGEGRVLFRDGRRSGTRESVQAAWRAKKKKEAGSAGYLLGEARGTCGRGAGSFVRHRPWWHARSNQLAAHSSSGSGELAYYYFSACRFHGLQYAETIRSGRLFSGGEA